MAIASKPSDRCRTHAVQVTLDAHGLAIAPGFINMLSWADEPLLVDGRSQSDIRQGVTLEVFGEGWSMGPLNARMKEELVGGQGDLKFPLAWTTLGEFLEHLEKKGISPNVASFVGATTVRIHELGYADRPPTDEELARMKELVRQAMREGALGVGSSLIYAPAFYAKTPELIELCKAAAEFGGMYISHMRSEGARLLEAIDELIQIAREAKVPAEIYHFKAAGRDNWPKSAAAIAKVEAARAQGLRITADMYTYPAGATGLVATMPPWVQEGGYDAWAARLRDPKIRKRLRREMETPTNEWENFFTGAGPDGILLAGFKKPCAQAAGRQAAQRRREAARHVSCRHGHGSRRRGRQPRRSGVLPDGGREPETDRRAAVDEFCVGCRIDRARGTVPRVEAASAHVWQLRPAAREVRA